MGKGKGKAKASAPLPGPADKLLYADAFTAHLGKEVEALCWSRGYVLLFHYGCTTGICQVNDTDCHAQLSRAFQDLETKSFIARQEKDDADINRTNQDVLDDAVGAWLSLDHEHGLRGHKRTGLANALDGSEDHLLNREALQFWGECEMPRLRVEALAEVRAKARDAPGGARMEAVRDHILHPAKGLLGEFIEGGEIDGELAEGERPWSDEDEAPEQERVASFLAACEEEAAGTDALAPAAETAVTQEEAAYAAALTRDRDVLRQMLASARDMAMPQVVWAAENRLRKLDARIREDAAGKQSRTGAPQKANEALRRLLEKEAAEDRARRSKVQKETAIRKQQDKINKAARKRAEADLRKARADLKAAKAAEEAKIAAIESLKVFSAKDFGSEAKDPRKRQYAKSREEALRRVRRLAGELPADLEARWEDFVVWYAAGVPKEETSRKARKTGLGFFRLIRDLQDGALRKAGDPGEAKLEFDHWLRDELSRMPKPDALTL